jgi:hypothetical protein
MPEERCWRLCGWVGETKEPEKKYCRREKKNILPTRWGARPAREKKIIYCRPARWGAWPAREKKIIYCIYIYIYIKAEF